MDKIVKKYKLFTILVFFCLMCIETSCIEEFIFHNKEAQKRVEFYKKQPRDNKLQGWWESKDKYSKNAPYFDFYDLVTGKEKYIYGSGDRCNNFWFTIDSAIYEAIYNKDWPNGMCEIKHYYRLKGANILEVSCFPIGECRRDDPNTGWNTWTRITDQVLLDSLNNVILNSN